MDQSAEGADALYGRAVIAEDEGRLGDALNLLHRVLALAPGHGAAQHRLAALLQRLNVSAAPSGEVAEPADMPQFYGIMASDAQTPRSPTSALSLECLKFIDSIAGERRPRRSAYPIRTAIAWGTGALLVLGAVFLLAMFLLKR